MMFKVYCFILLTSFLLCPVFTAYAKGQDSVMYYDFPQVNIIGKKSQLLDKTPGSATLVSELTLKLNQPISGNEIFKNVSGINIVEEEGAGLRTNIGIRGLDPDRSRTILMLEDGIPVALAPYGEPEMYYTPSIDRMSSIEIVKGSGSILFGPQTIGGVINYITPDPPSNSMLKLNLRSGSGGLVTGQMLYGTTVDNTGISVGLLHREADKIGITDFSLNDLFAKIKFQTGSNSRIGIKISAYDETSNSTYVGITQSMYDNGEYFVNVAPDDRLNIRRYSASLTHDLFISSASMLKTTVFGYTTSRNWLRQDFSRTRPVDSYGNAYGDTTVPGGAIYLRNSTGNRNRQFEVMGIEPRFISSFSMLGLKNEFEGGARFLFERAYEQRINGKKAGTLSGELREDEVRTGYAGSLFMLNRVFISEKISVAPGFRIESFDFGRDIYRINSRDTLIQANSNIFTVIPGFGINYNLQDITIFGGVHKGFAPPRIKDAINNSGVDLQLNAELSWNYEAGMRAKLFDRLHLETTFFILDFSNQVIPVSQSSGGMGAGLVNGGRTLHKGIEGGFNLEIFQKHTSDIQLNLRANATYSNSKYNSDRFITEGSEVINVNNNTLPYAPEFYACAGIEVMHGKISFLFNTTYTGKQFGDELNTSDLPANGLIGIIPEYFLLNTTARYFIEELGASVYLAAKNILDERYISTRRPEGIRTGLPRMLAGGIEMTF
jgi:Fe(3+) dicitrate transport protein